MQTLTRRSACQLMGRSALLAVGAACGLAACGLGVCAGTRTRQVHAEEATAAALADAQARYEAVQAEINDLAWQQEQASIALAETLDAMEAKQAEIAATQEQIAATQAELETCQEQLAAYVSDAYKHGETDFLDVLFGSSDFEELFRNIRYLTAINDSTTELIEHTREVKRQLEEQEAALQAQYAELDALREQQEWQLADIEQRQNEAWWLLSSLDAEVQALVEQYNQELIAQAQAAAEAAAAASGGGGSGGTAYGSSSASAVVNACYATPSPGAGYCAAWVSNVFVNAGIGGFYGDACDMYASWCYNSDRGSLQTGMIVAVSTWSGSTAGQIYGHVGVYIGGGVVMDNVGYIRSIDIDSWCATYGDTVTPRWGWLGGVALG